MTRLSNRPFDSLTVGETASITKVLTSRDLVVFAHASGNLNPLHLAEHDKDAAATAPSLWLAALLSAVLGGRLPGPGTRFETLNLVFKDRAHLGDRIQASVEVIEMVPPAQITVALTVTELSRNQVLAVGEALLHAPTQSMSFDSPDLPELMLQEHRHADRFLEACHDLDPLTTAVVAPEKPSALEGALDAMEAHLIAPILVGNPDRIKAAAEALGITLSSDIPIIRADSAHEAAVLAVKAVHDGQARAIMKGHLHTDQLLKPIIARDGGLRGDRRLSHIFVMDVPGHARPVLVTDAAINIAPDLTTKVDITQNAIDLAQALGTPTPKVGILSAVETVTPAIPSTLDAAVLSKMAERGQIKGGIVDGPLAMDNAIDISAAQTKGIVSMVAGRADVLVAPNLETANVLAKDLTYMAHAEGAGLVLGARVPIMLTSRADDAKSRQLSAALAVLLDHWQSTGQSAVAPLPMSDEPQT